MYYRHHQNYDYNQNDAHRRRHHPYQNPSYHRHQNPRYHDQNPNYHRHQNPSYHHQNPRLYHDQNYAYHHQNPRYYHDHNYAYLHQNPSYYHRPHQNRHQNPSYDQIPQHHQQRRQHHFYDQNLSCYHHQQHHRFYDQNFSHNHHHQQQNHRNRFCYQNLSYYPHHEIEAPHCAASNPTRLLVAKVKPKPKPKPPVVAVDFPVDVLILILARLPTKTLQKFRCVCKSWNSLIQQDHHFLSLHQLHLNDNKKRLPPLITLFGSFRTPASEVLDCVLNYSSSSSDTTPYEFNFTQLQQDPSYFITNSCNGLLGVYSCYSFFIVNPTIRKLKPLPTTWSAPGSLPQAALGFDASTGVHKVLRMFDREYEGFMPVRFGCEVYYLGGSGGWKLIDDPPVLPSCVSSPVVVDGAIIWASETVLCKKHLEVVALSFDLREEKFSVILHPEGSSRCTFPRSHKSHVFASEGRMCVADEIISPVPSAHMNIWLLMKDVKKNSSKWVKQYVINLAYVLKRIGLFCTAQPLTTDHNGRIVISWGQGRKDYYDPRTGSFDKHELNARVDVEHVTPYTESMVWPWPRLSGAQ